MQPTELHSKQETFRGVQWDGSRSSIDAICDWVHEIQKSSAEYNLTNDPKFRELKVSYSCNGPGTAVNWAKFETMLLDPGDWITYENHKFEMKRAAWVAERFETPQ